MSIFSKNKKQKYPKSKFNLSHSRKFSCKMGDIVPCLMQEVLPSDEWAVGTQQIVRLAPMVNPTMADINVTLHYYFVPNRIIWDLWEDFIRGGDDGLDSTVFPTIGNLPVAAGDLADYLGLPQMSGTEGEKVSSLPFLAYNMIYNEYYRDQNLIEEVKNPTEEEIWKEGNIVYSEIADFEPNFFNIKKRAWIHDYFTSALPEAQKGNPVKIPLINTAGQYLDVEFNRTGGDTKLVRQNDGGVSNDGSGLTWPQDTFEMWTDGGLSRAAVDNSEQLQVPLDSLDTKAALINDLRNAFSLQRWAELANRGGSRFREFLYNFFGVVSDDARFDVPEFLGGSVSPIMISEVLQTSETSSSPQGNMAGHALNLGKDFMFNRYFKEHGILMGLVNIQPKTVYAQGIPKFWSKKDKFDFAFSQLEHIGEQPILNKEIYVANDGQNNDEFGYIPRYAEYKYIPSSVHGEFKTSMTDWHMARLFENRPHLNKEFIEADPTTRVFAVDEPNVCWVEMWHNVQCKRQLSYYSDPGMTKL